MLSVAVSTVSPCTLVQVSDDGRVTVVQRVKLSVGAVGSERALLQARITDLAACLIGRRRRKKWRRKKKET